MIRPLVIAIVSAIYLIASMEAQQPGTYNNVLSYFKEHPLIDKNGAPTDTFKNVLNKVSTMSSSPAGARPAAIPPVTPYRPNGYSPNYAQYQAYAQAQYRQAQAQAQARTAAMFPPVPGTTPPQAPPPASAPPPSQPAPEPAPAEKHEEPAPQPESSPEPQAASEPQPEPQAAPEEPSAPEPQASAEEAKPSEPAPEPQAANEEQPAWSAQGSTDSQPAEETEQVQPAAEENANSETAPSQGEEQQQPEEASVTPAGDTDGTGTLEITTEANDLGIPPASGNMNNITNGIQSNSSMANGSNTTANGMMGSSVGIGGSSYTYSSIDMMAPSNSAQSPPSAPTTYIPPMASTGALNTRFDDLLCLTLLLVNVMAFIL